jgi:hypothetical protein
MVQMTGFLGGDMRITRVMVILAGVFLLAATPVSVQAQGCYGWVCPGPASSGSAPSIFTGYFFQTKGADISFNAPEWPTNSVIGLRQQFDLQGIWTELMVPVKGCGPAGLVLGWAYLFPLDRTSHETQTFSVAGTATRTWTADPQWWYLQGALTYDVYPMATVIAGFRYDSFQTNFYDPSVRAADPTVPNDTANVTINGYIPFFGVAISNVAPRTGLDIEIGAIGFPTVMGSVNYVETVGSGIQIRNTLAPGFTGYNEFDKGYFLEAFAEFGVPLMYGWQAGAFMKYTTLNASTTVDVGERNGQIDNTDFECTFDRRSWVIGGRVSLCF